MDTSPSYLVTLSVRVDDPEAVYNAAIAKHRDVDPQTAREDFEDEDGNINIEACLGYLYDPGESVPGSELWAVECEEE
ncbi:hypothetical protein [Burkholderia pseudomallei]|uniref:hypothetical protein n=1 Tax=Burkholderia pseudomallei TaxID=28450 RepID=UPI00190A21AB|nr:hypothetical protein [Burkholderia pseudomallei]MBK3333520.1 hypothetical protein [Burkholderia pseudomallei]